MVEKYLHQVNVLISLLQKIITQDLAIIKSNALWKETKIEVQSNDH